MAAPASSLASRANGVLDAALADPDPKVQAEALETLGISGRPDALKTLLREVDGGRGELRFASARGLALLGDPGAADALARAFKDEKGWAVKRELALAAGACHALSLVPELHKALDDKNGEVQVAAAWALKDLGDPSADAALKRLGNPERKAPFKPGSDKWSRKVLSGLKEGDRSLASRTLARFGDEADVKLLEPLLGAKEAPARIWAAAGLLRLVSKPAQVGAPAPDAGAAPSR